MESLEDIEKMSDEEIKKIFDDKAKTTSAGTAMWWDIYVGKQQDNLNKAMLKYTKKMFYLTVAVVIATIISLIISVISLLISLKII